MYHAHLSCCCVNAVFGEVEFVEAAGVSGETGFLTAEMTEEAFEEKAAALEDIRQRIRVV